LSNMKVLDPTGSQIQELQQVEDTQYFLKHFLDKCFEQDSPYAKFAQSLGDLACYKHEDIPVVIQNLRSVSELLVTLIAFERSIQVQFSDCNDFLKNFKPPQIPGSSSIGFKYFHAYLIQLLDTMTQRNEFLAAFVNDYWDYIPDRSQNAIIKSVSFFSSANLPTLDFSELNEINLAYGLQARIQSLKSSSHAYASSANFLKGIFSPSFIQASSFVPKILISKLKIDNLQKDTTSDFNYLPLIANKGYTLDTLLQKVTLP